jgi:hypothetical protein
MKTIFTCTAWLIVIVAILFAALNPSGGVLYQGTMSAVGLGLIGLGICIEARKSLLKSRVPKD